MAKLLSSLLSLAVLLAPLGAAWAARPSATKPECNNNIVLTMGDPLKFGGFVPDPALTGTVTLDPVSGLRTATGVILEDGQNGQRGYVDVSLNPAFTADCSMYQLIITLTPFTISNSIETMGVTLATEPQSGVASLATGGTLRVYLGGTLTVNANQGAGFYSGPYSVDIVFR